MRGNDVVFLRLEKLFHAWACRFEQPRSIIGKQGLMWKHRYDQLSQQLMKVKLSRAIAQVVVLFWLIP